MDLNRKNVVGFSFSFMGSESLDSEEIAEIHQELKDELEAHQTEEDKKLQEAIFSNKEYCEEWQKKRKEENRSWCIIF